MATAGDMRGGSVRRATWSGFRADAVRLLESQGCNADAAALTSMEGHDRRREVGTVADYLKDHPVGGGQPTDREWAWLAAYVRLARTPERFYLSGIALDDDGVIWPDKSVMASFLRAGLVSAKDRRFILSDAATQRTRVLLAILE